MTTSTAPQSSGIHLTRRGRLVLLGLPSLLASVAVAALLIFGITGLMNQAQASSEHVTGVEAVEVTVALGTPCGTWPTRPRVRRRCRRRSLESPRSMV
ncbi:hypothetical protein [Nesterenkonia pannonica]|uniref:hypothetical protein n=1 Tax=Nesterenkonia pannonica TaxID=1548602 RepID=UPI0021647A72|nr:hypothetical protein [Nesterenkonia pannonica]